MIPEFIENIKYTALMWAKEFEGDDDSRQEPDLTDRVLSRAARFEEYLTGTRIVGYKLCESGNKNGECVLKDGHAVLGLGKNFAQPNHIDRDGKPWSDE